MSPLEPIAGQLAQLIEAVDSPERHALAQVLTERLFQVLAIPPVPMELRVPFGNPFEPGVPLADWCLARLPVPKTRASALLPLLPIAALLDALADADTPLLVFVPEWFRVDERGRPLVFPPLFSLGMKMHEETHLNERQRRSYAHLLHPSVLRTLAHCDLRSSLLYSFALFLARMLLKVQHDDARTLLHGLRRCRQQDRTLPPELPELLHAVLSRPLDRPPGCTCAELIDLTLGHVKENPFVCRAMLNRSTEHELFAYSVFGAEQAAAGQRGSRPVPYSLAAAAGRRQHQFCSRGRRRLPGGPGHGRNGRRGDRALVSRGLPGPLRRTLPERSPNGSRPTRALTGCRRSNASCRSSSTRPTSAPWPWPTSCATRPARSFPGRRCVRR